ncbi:MAG: apolipoprotein N-acyltransferase, partial [Limnohabitans sp.]|nr:apolipoprotein N-acyltransferase [Limnohabitans sp.]
MGSDAQRFSRLWLGALIAAGIAQGWSLAWPWGEDARGETVPALSIVALVLLARSLGGVVTPRDAAWRSGVFHVAAFATSFGWLHISMHQFGGMPLLAAVAAVGVLAAGLALIPAGVFYLAWRLRAGRPGRIADTAVFAGAWLLAECLRAQLGTGFPWGAIGYAQVDSPLRALAPWMGVYGLGFVVAALAYLLANGFRRVRSWRAHWVRLLWVGGVAGLTLVAADKAQPVLQATPGLQVRLLQGNVPQDQKFVHQLQASLMDYGQALLS